MKTKYLQQLSILMILMASTLITGSAQKTTQAEKQKSATEQKKSALKYKVTFIELGSVRCIPCQKMQGVMKSIEQKYGNQVKVVFHDVWTPEGKPFGEKYGVEQIPTQVFLDENGKEFSRHIGYFPEEELIALLKTKGIK
jgi:thioredoxin 1